MTPMAVSRAERVRVNLDESVGYVFPSSEPYTLSDYLVLFFLAGDSDFNAYRPLHSVLLLPLELVVTVCDHCYQGR